MQKKWSQPASKDLKLEWLRIHLCIKVSLSLSFLPFFTFHNVIEFVTVHKLSYIQFQGAKTHCFPIVISSEVSANSVQALHVLSAAFCMPAASVCGLPALCLLIHVITNACN